MQKTLHYQIYGSGIPIMLVHGFGEDSSIWETQINTLQQHFLLVVPDLPGSGKSPLGTEPITMESMANDLLRILEAEKIEKCIMLGHSMGGYVTLAFAENFPEKLLGFGLIHSTAYADSEEKKEIRRKAIDFILQHGAHAFLKTSIPNLFADTFQTQHPETVQSVIAKAASFTPEALIAYYKAMMNRKDRSSVLHHSQVPVLIFIGEQDKAVPPADALEQSSFPAICQVEVLPEAGHMGMLEAPERLNNSIKDFVQLVQTSSNTIA